MHATILAADNHHRSAAFSAAFPLATLPLKLSKRTEGAEFGVWLLLFFLHEGRLWYRGCFCLHGASHVCQSGGAAENGHRNGSCLKVLEVQFDLFRICCRSSGRLWRCFSHIVI